MIHSTWGDWFRSDEVEAAEPDVLTCWYLGCNAFVLRSPEATIYVDPYFGDGRPPLLVRMVPVPMDPATVERCDAIVCTHEHLDHVHPPSYRPIVENTGATMYAPAASYDQADCDVRAEHFSGGREVVSPGDSYAVGDLTIHVRGANDPDAIEPVSYVVEHESGTFFHGGDSRVADAFSEIGTEFDLDVGVLAFGTVGRQYYPDADEVRTRKVYMDENELVESANRLRLDRLVPSHYRMWHGFEADPSALRQHASTHVYPKVIEPVDIGDRFDVSEPGVKPPFTIER